MPAVDDPSSEVEPSAPPEGGPGTSPTPLADSDGGGEQPGPATAAAQHLGSSTALANISAAAFSGMADVCGWLWQEGSRNQVFKKRWVSVVTETQPKLFDDTILPGSHVLCIFESDAAPQPQRVVVLRPNTFSCGAPESVRKGWPHSFRISLKRGVELVLAAADATDCARWTERLSAGSFAEPELFRAWTDTRSRQKKVAVKMTQKGVTMVSTSIFASRDSETGWKSQKKEPSPEVEAVIKDLLAEETITFEAIHYEIDDHVLLDSVTGYAAPGGITAIMGPSGAGKTTLLNLLAGRLTGKGRVSGSLRLNGCSVVNSLSQSRVAAIVPQHDVLIDELTVREMLEYCAKLQLSHVSGDMCSVHVEDALFCLGLQPFAESTIRSLSGGERKRVSVAADGFLTPSHLLFLDEPTTGLSSSEAVQLMNILAALARERNYTIVCSIHQPSREVFQLLDTVLLLAKGCTVFFGPRQEATPYFEEAGGIVPEDGFDAISPDAMMDCVSGEAASSYVNSYAVSMMNETTKDAIAEINATEKPIKAVSRHSFVWNCVAVTRVQAVVFYRTGVFVSPFLLSCAYATLLGAIYWRQTSKTAGAAMDLFRGVNSVLSMDLFFAAIWIATYVSTHKKVDHTHALITPPLPAHAHAHACPNHLPAQVQHELAKGMYGEAVHAASWIMLTLAKVIIQLIPLAIAHYMMDLNVPLSRFAFYFASLNLVVHLVALVMATLSSSVDVATGNFGLFLLYLMQFQGFMVSKEEMPGAVGWLVDINPYRQALEAAAYGEFSERFISCGDAEFAGGAHVCPFPGDLILQHYKLSANESRRHIVMVSWVLAAVLIRSLLLWQQARQRRSRTVSSDTAGTAGSPAGGVSPRDKDIFTQATTDHAFENPVAEAAEPNLAERQPSDEVQVAPSANRNFEASDDPDQTVGKGLELTFANVDYAIDPGARMRRVFEDSSGINLMQVLLRNVYGRAIAGGILGIIGKSGAGKSVLLDLLAGRMAPDRSIVSGTIAVGGTAFEGSLTQQRIASYVGDDQHLLDELTISESFEIAAALQLPGQSARHQREQRCSDALALLDLTQHKHKRVRDLSGGQCKRVTIGIDAILTPCKILFLEEPTSGLSSTDATQLMQSLQKLAKKFTLTMIVTLQQPSGKVINTLATLLILSRSRAAYSGLGGTAAVAKFFSSAGLALPADMDEMIPLALDWLDDAAVLEHSATYSRSCYDADGQLDLLAGSQEGATFSDDSNEADRAHVLLQPPEVASRLRQVMIFARRAWLLQMRSAVALNIYFFNSIVTAIIVGLLYWRIPKIQSKGEQSGCLSSCFNFACVIATESNALFLHLGFLPSAVYDLQGSLYTAVMIFMFVSLTQGFSVGDSLPAKKNGEQGSAFPFCFHCRPSPMHFIAIVCHIA